MLQQRKIPPKHIGCFSEGEYDHKAWIREGNNLLISSRVLRDTYIENNKNFLAAPSPPNILSLLSIDISLPSTSLLLIGYAVEMYLKAALVQIFIGCSEQILKTAIKRKFSHNLLNIAQHLKYPTNKTIEEDLTALQEIILKDGRYPISMGDGEACYPKSTERASKFSDQETYERYYSLADSLREYADTVGGNFDNRVSCIFWTIFNDGYITMRHGGVGPNRITFRLSQEMKAMDAPLAELERMIQATCPFLAEAWKSFEIYEEVVEVSVSLKSHQGKK